jgi:hypothetical protein
MADHAKNISGGYNKDMKADADPLQAAVMATVGAEQESFTLGIIPSASSADLQCLLPKWTIGRLTGAT